MASRRTPRRPAPTPPDSWPAVFWKICERGGAVWLRGLILVLLIIVALMLGGGHLLQQAISLLR